MQFSGHPMKIAGPCSLVDEERFFTNTERTVFTWKLFGLVRHASFALDADAERSVFETSKSHMRILLCSEPERKYK